MCGEATARDHVWAAIIERGRDGRAFTLESIKQQIGYAQQPSDETIRRVLRSGTELGVIDHTDGSPYYSLKD